MLIFLKIKFPQFGNIFTIEAFCFECEISTLAYRAVRLLVGLGKTNNSKNDLIILNFLAFLFLQNNSIIPIEKSLDYIVNVVGIIKIEELTELFAQDKSPSNLKGIFGSVFQSVFGQDAYQIVEDKATDLRYFIIKNNTFNDGNKRSGIFSFN